MSISSSLLWSTVSLLWVLHGQGMSEAKSSGNAENNFLYYFSIWNKNFCISSNNRLKGFSQFEFEILCNDYIRLWGQLLTAWGLLYTYTTWIHTLKTLTLNNEFTSIILLTFTREDELRSFMLAFSKLMWNRDKNNQIEGEVQTP